MNDDKPQFHLTRVLDDGSSEAPVVVPVRAMPWATRMDRRGALGVGLTATALFTLLDRAHAQGTQTPRPATPPQLPTQAPQPAPRAHTGRVSAIVLAPSGELIASASEDNTIKLWSIADGRLVTTILGHTDDVTALAISPDGRVLASAGKDGAINLWATATGRAMGTLAGHGGTVWALTFTPDTSVLASGSGDTTIRLWSIPEGRLLSTLEGHTSAVRALTTIGVGAGAMLASGSEDRTIRLWSIATNRLTAALTGHTGAVILLCGGDATLTSASDDGTVKTWSVTDLALKDTVDAHTGGVKALAATRQGTLIASAGQDSRIKVWSPATPTTVNDLRASGPVTAMEMSPNLLVSGDREGAVALWAVAPEKFKTYLQDPALNAVEATKAIKAHSGAVTCLSVSPDGNTLVSGSADKLIKLWSIADGSLTGRLAGHTDGVTALALPRDGGQYISASTDKSILVWSLENAVSKPAPAPSRGKAPSPPVAPPIRGGKIDLRLEGHTDAVLGLALAGTSPTLISSSKDKSIRIWNLKEGATEAVLQGHTSAVGHLTVSPDGAALASAAERQDVRLWSIRDGRSIAPLRQPSGLARTAALCMSPDSRQLAVGDQNGQIELWSVFDGRRSLVLAGAQSPISILSFTTNPDRLVSGAADGAVSVWSLGERRLVARLEGPAARTRGGIVGLVLSADGTLAASGHEDGTIALWSLESLQLLAAFRGQPYVGLTAIAMTPDGRRLAAGDSSGVISIWDLEKHTLHGYLFDQAANDTNTKGQTYNVLDKITGQTISYTLPCGTPIPAGAICTCNCVPGTVAVPTPSGGSGGGGSRCICNRVCTCVPISSARWKVGIRPLAHGLAQILRLRSVRFEWAPDAPQGHVGSDIGFIAEEVAEILPEVVARDDQGRPCGVDYSRVTVSLVEAVKEQQRQIDSLRCEVERLRKEALIF